MSPTYSGSLGFHVGLSSKVRESEGMLKRGHAGLEAVVDAVVDLGRVDVGMVVDVGMLVDFGSVVDVESVLDVGSDFCCVFSSCVFSSWV